ncbi:MAG: protein kinase [Phycisphaerae bacterium]|jgi:serine/threonine-protein kinase
MSAFPESIGPYTVRRELGRGGMGEVYLARDTKLSRDVAIKVLPATMTRDPERVARFEREAKLLASLNHPNIAAIYGFDDSDGTRFLVMEYVEGQTLADCLKTGPLALEDALDIARQMAEALEAAHEQGVIHRDLKPGNVMLREDGSVKVLDFGLAKAMSEEPSSSATADSPTITANYTRPGVVLGTAAYMSPEQARGRALDKRTDIWSFGIILFECLTGVSMFRGETATDSMGAIMHKEPDWSSLPPGTPPTVQLLLRRCLAKDRKRRLHDIADARIELENAIVDPASTSLGLAAAALDVPRRRFAQVWIITMVAVVAVLGGGVGWWVRPIPPAPVVRLALPLPADYELTVAPNPVLSPDGRTALFRVKDQSGTETEWVVRPMDQQELRPLPQMNGADRPFFSPDSAWVAFAQNEKLKKMSLSGGAPITLCDAPAMRGGAWGSDGSIIFAPEEKGGLMRVSAAGGIPEPFTEVDPADEFASHRSPSLLPDGRGVIFTAARDYGPWDASSIMVVPASGQSPRELVKRGGPGRYVAPGLLLFVREHALMACRFDLDRLELAGQPVSVVEGVTAWPGAPPQFSVGANGTLTYIPTSDPVAKQLVLIDQSGKEEPIGQQRGDFDDPRLSPDNRYVALEISLDSGKHIAVLERDRDILRMLRSSSYDSEPVWSPDGKWVVYASRREGRTKIFRVDADLAGGAKQLTSGERPQLPGDWTSHGQSLVFMERVPATDGDIHTLKIDQQGNVTGDPVVIDDASGWQLWARYSPDGQWIGYASYESGSGEIFVRAADGSGSPVRVSTAGGTRMAWSPTEDRLWYLTGDAPQPAMYSVNYTLQDGEFRPSAPEVAFSFEEPDAYDESFDITADGKQFLFVRTEEGSKGAAAREPIVVLNWTKELETLVPAD